jgi:hypothetical protein
MTSKSKAPAYSISFDTADLSESAPDCLSLRAALLAVVAICTVLWAGIVAALVHFS